MQKYDKEKSFFMFLYGGSKPPPYEITPNYAGSQNKKYVSIPSTHRLYQFTHQNSNREVRCSPTWHSSESESARGRFEPVAVAKLRLDGLLAMFAPEGDGCSQRAKWEDAGRFSKEGKSLDDFWYFWSHKSTIKRKLLFYFSHR